MTSAPQNHGQPFDRPAADAPSSAILAARKAAARRTRRIIMNNDGNDLNRVAPDQTVTPDLFLNARTTTLAGSQVDAIFYCTGVFNHYTHRSPIAELLDSEQSAARRVHELIPLGTDSLETIVRFCHENDMEAFWSMRMNDTHDASPSAAFLMTRWKRQHPDWLVGKPDGAYPYACGRWSALDYGIPAVREQTYALLADVAARYDVDGLELDFFRHPVLFRQQLTGEPVTAEHRAMMTDLIRRIRTMADEVAEARGRPLLLAMRGFDSVGFSNALGIDLERWLGEGLIDLFAAGDYFKFEPWENLAALGRRYEVPVYAGFASRRITGGGRPEAASELKIWRGEALAAWRAGVAGIYTFNRFDPNDPIFRELGDPERLATLPRKDQETFVAPIWSRPERWLKDGDRFVRGKPCDRR